MLESIIEGVNAKGFSASLFNSI